MFKSSWYKMRSAVETFSFVVLAAIVVSGTLRLVFSDEEKREEEEKYGY